MDSIHLDFTTLEFYDNYVLSHVKDNVVLDHPQVNEMLSACKAHFNGKSFVYISHRKKSYNVNPLVYYKLDNYTSLAGICIVCERFETCQMAEFEKQFAKIPFKIHNDLEPAINWAKNIQKNKKADL